MDGDAEDAREAEEYYHNQSASTTSPPNNGSGSGTAGTPSSLTPPPPPWTPLPLLGGGPGSGGSSAAADRRTPSPVLKPGYDRHEVEGIGGVMKKMRVRMVKVGACVPEWEDERVKGEILGRELQGKRRSWCGWCRRVIPSRKDLEGDGLVEGKGKEVKVV